MYLPATVGERYWYDLLLIVGRCSGNRDHGASSGRAAALCQSSAVGLPLELIQYYGALFIRRPSSIKFGCAGEPPPEEALARLAWVRALMENKIRNQNATRRSRAD